MNWKKDFFLCALGPHLRMANRKPKKGKGFGLTETAWNPLPSGQQPSCNCNVNVNTCHKAVAVAVEVAAAAAAASQEFHGCAMCVHFADAPTTSPFLLLKSDHHRRSFVDITYSHSPTARDSHLIAFSMLLDCRGWWREQPEFIQRWDLGNLGATPSHHLHHPTLAIPLEDLSERVYFNVTFWHLCSFLPSCSFCSLFEEYPVLNVL